MVSVGSPTEHGTHELQLRIHPDPYCEGERKEFFQWFHFRVANCKGEELRVNITNAGEGGGTFSLMSTLVGCWRG